MRRSLLFLPGNTPNMIINGEYLGADSLILDLEDAVAPDQKDAARILVRNALKFMEFGSIEIIVRINSLDTPYWKEDLDEVIQFKPVIMPTKVSSTEDIAAIEEYIASLEVKLGIVSGTVKLIPLIETALGVEKSFSIASCSRRVDGIFLGAEDLTADTRSIRSKEGHEIFYARTKVVTAARAAGVEVYDTPFTDVDDDEGIVRDARLARELGFSGKASISPRHVQAINEAFTPTQKEIDYAYQVIRTIKQAEHEGRGAVSLYGKMIDRPIVLRAQRVIEIAEAVRGGADRERQ